MTDALRDAAPRRTSWRGPWPPKVPGVVVAVVSRHPSSSPVVVVAPFAPAKQALAGWAEGHY
eukprot:9502835-Pyramimonas_sp.AAC.1